MANDRTAEYVIKLIGRDEDLRRKVQGAISDMQKMSGQANLVTRANGAIMSSLKGIAAAGAAAFTTKALIDYTREAANLAAQGEGIRTAFAKLNQPGLLDELKKATRGTASEMKLMQTAIQAANFKIPLTQLATYLKFATNRALETGQSVDYLVESLITGIGRQSPLILDNLGLSAIEISEAFKKAGDFGLAVGQIIQKELAKSGDVADTAAVKIQRHAATVDNLKEAWGNAVNAAGIWQDTLTSITDNLDNTTLILNARSIPVWEKFWGIVKTSVFGIDDTAKEAAKAVAEQEILEAAAIARAKDRRGEFTGWTIKELEKAKAIQQKIGDATALENVARIDKEIARQKAQAEAMKGVAVVKVRTLQQVNDELKAQRDLMLSVNVNDSTAVALIRTKIAALDAERVAYEKLFEAQTKRKKDPNAPQAIEPRDGQQVTTNYQLPGLQTSSAALIAFNAVQVQAMTGAERAKEAISGLGGSFAYLGNSITGAAGSWLGFAGTLLEQIPALITQIAALSGAQAAATAVSVAGSGAETAASLTTASAKQAEAMSKGVASGAGLPFPANLIAIAAIVASIGSIIAAIPKPKKFAAGGIISGPTLGLMGEYPGASNNPEVVAPLDKLKGMIGERSGAAAISVDDIILTGDQLRIVLRASERKVSKYT